MIDLIKYADRLKVTSKEGLQYVYDFIRKKNIILQSEELIRQCILHYLVDELEISINLIKSEKGIKVNKLYRRCDIIAYHKNGHPLLIVECKSAKVKLDQKVFNQIAMYNIPLRVPFLMVSNGKETYFCQIDFENKSYVFLDALPPYDIMVEKSKFEENN